tara:strand:- start:2122 stop:2577 length:456 start_codon:yes stop_codon:yes gene_type:complete
MDTVEIKIEVSCPGQETDEDKTRGSIKINNKVIEKIDLTGKETKELTMNVYLEDETHTLEIEHSYSENPKTALVINKIVIEDIDIGVIAYEGEYRPIYPEPWYSDETAAGRPPKEIIGKEQDGSACLFMGWEGTYKLQFSTPLYEWLLQKI